MFTSALACHDALIDGGNTANVERMDSMLASATSFQGPLGAWDVETVKDMPSRFEQANAFDQPISA